MSRVRLEQSCRFIALQRSGAFVLIHLGLMRGTAVCTESEDQRWVEAAGYEVLDRPFHASGALKQFAPFAGGEALSLPAHPK